MAYNHDYIEDLALFVSEVTTLFGDVEDALNDIDIADIPREVFDTQHFSENWALGYADSEEDASGQFVVDDTSHAVSSWPPVYSEWAAGLSHDMSAMPWDQSGPYQALEVFANANLAQVTGVSASPPTRFLMAIAVRQGATWTIVPRTVRAFSVPDHKVSSGGITYMDMPVHTVLRQGDLALSADVNAVRVVWGVHNGSGSTVCYVGGRSMAVLQKRTGNLGA